eukprot:gb/GFBE01012314.1/.p1 GENE.gb/GFBE01012314.1/~~gb/GFBE01012314.1/.p1  ORF type:complete len:123 (+),score=35.36 gb/GFBE01012314.1/:1-369(+)
MAEGEPVDPLLEAEALIGEEGIVDSDEADLYPPAEGPDDAGNEEGDAGEDLGGGGATEDSCAVEPKYAVGQALQVLRSENVYAACTVVAADKTEMGPMYAVRFQEDGSIQSLVPEHELRAAS